MNDTKIFIDCPSCGHYAELISLPFVRYRCAACHAVWMWTPRGLVADTPSEYNAPEVLADVMSPFTEEDYINYSPEYDTDQREDNRLWNASQDNEEMIE